jgi:Transcriptional regulator
MNISTRQLRAFGAVARLASFTRAAQQLHMTQAGLSGMIRELESQLGARLFDRTTRTVTLTAMGSAMLPVATQVLEQLDTVVETVGKIGSAARRTLAVATTPMLSSSVLPAVIRAFMTLHPNVALRVRDLDRSQIQSHVDSGELDAGFGVFLSAAVGIHRAPLLKLPLLLAAPGLESLPNAVTWRSLRSTTLLALPVDNPVQRVIDEHLARIGRSNEERLHFNNFNTLLGMVEAGLGNAVVPSFARQANRYRVRFAELTQPRVSLDFYQITKSGRELNPVLADFSRLLAEVLASEAT